MNFHPKGSLEVNFVACKRRLRGADAKGRADIIYTHLTHSAALPLTHSN